MKFRTIASALGCVGLLYPLAAMGYPGGTPDFQTDVTPFCASCHSSVEESALQGAKGDRAAKEMAANKHLAPIMAGHKNYKDLSEADRGKLVELLKSVDANSKIEMEYPPQVAAGETFQVKVSLSGGAGPVVAVGLVDRPHRWYARSAATVGWTIVGAPTVIGSDGSPQSGWIGKRPELLGRNITFVNVTNWKSDADAGKWAKGKVIFTLKAPDKPGDYPLVGSYFYGTEKAVSLSTVSNPNWGDQPLGSYQGKSGRVRFTPRHVITVK
jgi:hypothetical protein